jgi:hypothetical protein
MIIAQTSIVMAASCDCGLALPRMFEVYFAPGEYDTYISKHIGGMSRKAAEMRTGMI